MNFFKKTISLFTNNWWLKLIALLLAIVIYSGEKYDQTHNQNHNSRNDRPLFQQFR